MKRIAVSLIFVFLTLACNKLSNLGNPAAPSRSDPGNPNYTDLKHWYPCVVVHTPGFRGSPEFEGQMSAIRKLYNAGRLDWIRLGTANLRGDGRDYAVDFKRLGSRARVLGIIGTDDLETGSSWENIFDRMYDLYRSEVDIWEIGGEVSNSAINRKTLTPEYYMERLKSLHNYVEKRYSSVVSRNLTSAPTIGSGGGPAEFERFIELGLLDMDIIVTVNIYDFSKTGHTLQNYASIFSRYSEQLSKRRVWITETGSHIREEQVKFVQTSYPEIINATNAQMACWYVLWAGDNSGDTGHALLNNLLSGVPDNSNLFKRLTGEMQ